MSVRETIKLDNKEPHNISGAKGGVKKPVLALEIEKTPSFSRSREGGLMEVIETVDKLVSELEAPVKREMSNK